MDGLIKKRIYGIDGMDVMLVDGGFVRNHISDEFIGGGNPFVYDYIHDGEYWLEEANVMDEKKFAFYTLVHEMYESWRTVHLMEKYKEAHDMANLVEQKCRTALIDVDGESVTPDGIRKLIRICMEKIDDERLSEWLGQKYLTVVD